MVLFCCACPLVAYVVAAYVIVDIVVAGTSVAFVTRTPASLLRTVILNFVSFLTLAVAFSVL